MKHHSLFYTTDSAKSKKLSLKFFSFFIAVLICFSVYGAAVPAYAATSYVPITVTVDMFQAMFESGDLVLTATVTNSSSTSSRYQYWDILNQSALYLTPGETLICQNPQFTKTSGNEAYIWFPYNLFANYPIYSTVYYSIDLPFDYYGGTDSELWLTALTPGKTTDRVTGALSLFDSNNGLISSQEVNSISQGFLPSNSPLYEDLQALDAQYEFIADFMYNSYNFIINSGDTLIDHISFVVNVESHGISLTQSDVVPGIGLHNVTMYVPGTPTDPDDPDSPTYAEVVEEYLTAIVDLDNQTQSEIDVLKSKLEAVDFDLNNISNQLVVPKPDISNGISTIDTDLLNGTQMFSEKVMTPLFDQGIIIILFTGIFSIVSIKLILFGSGKS